MRFLRRVRALFARRRLDAEMSEEMRLHLEMQTEENIARGMSPEEAHYAARREFGGVDQLKESAREQRGFVWVAQLWQDLAYGMRSLRKHAGFTSVAVLTLALGVGVNAMIFSIVNDLIFRPGLRNRELNLVAIQTARVGGDRNYRPFNHAEFAALRAGSEIFSDVAAMQFGFSLVGDGDDVQRRMLCFASENYFSTLRVRPFRGRFFSADESAPAARAAVAVASYDFWERMGAKENFLGSQIEIDGVSFTIIGITPAGFGGLHWSNGPDAWLPLGQLSNFVGAWGIRAASGDLLDPKAYMLQVFGTLHPGMTVAEANARLAPLSARLNALTAANASDARELTVSPPARSNFNIAWPTDESAGVIYAGAALGMTVTVLLVACLNVANMLFNRGLSRRREIAIRLSLGASRWRVVRQLLVEGMLLALAGGATGLLLSRWGNSVFLDMTRTRAGYSTLHLRTTFDWTLLGAIFVLCLLATLVVSLAPALRATRLDLVEDLKTHSAEAAGTGRWDRFFSLRHCLAMAQIAISLALLFGASLLVHAVRNAERDRGFALESAVVANLDYKLAKTPPAEIPRRQRALLAAANGMPGVERAALASAVPFNFETNFWRIFAVKSASVDSAGGVVGEGSSGAAYTVVSHGYFATMGIPVLHGRDFTESEATQGNSPRVAIIDDTLGRALFGEADPLGRHIALKQSEADGKHAQYEIEIVGIVRSPREDAFQASTPMHRLYRPFGQTIAAMDNTYLHVKTASPAAVPTVIEKLRHDLRALDPRTPVLACEPLQALIEKNLNVWSVRLIVYIFGAFGLVAVLLAVIGVYGVKSYIVTRRTHEIGVRIAIGARTRDVLTLLLRQSLLQAAVGIAAGLVLAVLAGQFLAKLLYQVSAVDAVALVGAALLLGFVSVAACLVPAWRATRINPMTALRDE